MDYSGEIYIGTVALERNRWSKAQVPSFQVSPLLERIREAGFDGVELWQNHAIGVSNKELLDLRSSQVPIKIFNSYVNFEKQGHRDRYRVAKLVSDLNCEGVKFNFGKQSQELSTYMSHFEAWLELLPINCRVLCECHAGTVLEEASTAHRVLSLFGDPRIEIIIHGPSDRTGILEPWFELFGEKITHMHLQTRLGCYDQQSEIWAERFAAVHKIGFKGSFAIEFTEGSASKDEAFELVWNNALSDLNFVRAQL